MNAEATWDTYDDGEHIVLSMAPTNPASFSEYGGTAMDATEFFSFKRVIDVHSLYVYASSFLNGSSLLDRRDNRELANLWLRHHPSKRYKHGHKAW